VVAIARRYVCDPAGLSERQVADFLLFLRCERKYAPSSMAQTIVALRTFFRDHLSQEWQLWKTVRVRQIESLPWVLSIEEVAAVIAAARLKRFRVLFTLIYHCGLRLGESLRIAPTDIDDKAGRIHIRNAKGGKDRYVPVTPTMVGELRVLWRMHRNAKWLFPGLGRGWKGLKITAEEAAAKSDHHISEAGVQIAFQRCVADSGIGKRATVHTLRHSYATHLLEAGIALPLISKYLGHSSIKTTVVYTHLTSVSEDKTRAALDLLHASLSKTP
jgi:integrase